MDGERTYMKFEKVVIKNFRNFDNVELDLSLIHILQPCP